MQNVESVVVAPSLDGGVFGGRKMYEGEMGVGEGRVVDGLKRGPSEFIIAMKGCGVGEEGERRRGNLRCRRRSWRGVRAKGSACRSSGIEPARGSRRSY